MAFIAPKPEGACRDQVVYKENHHHFMTTGATENSLHQLQCTCTIVTEHY